MQTEPVELMRQSVPRTQAAGTAALRFVPSRYGGSESFAKALEDGGHRGGATALRLADRTFRRVSAAIASSEIAGQPGVADFAQQRFLYDEGAGAIACLTLFAPGEEYTGGPDDWERVSGDPQVIGRSEPAWLLALIAGVVDARREDREMVLGQQSTRYAATVSFTEAVARCEWTLERPRTSDDVELDRLPCQVWLDTEGRILKAVLHHGESRMIIELSQFGAPDPVQLPDAGSVWSADDDPSR